MQERLFSLLNNKRTYRAAALLAILSGLTTFYYGHVTGFSDEGHYWSLAEGLHHGQFSAWYFLPVPVPETLRTWGYPFFLYACQFISGSRWCPQLIQLGLYVITILMILRLIRHYFPQRAARTIFLFLLVFNNHLAFYAGILIAESITLFFTVLFAYVYVLCRPSWRKFAGLALISFALYQLRPIFMLFPFLLVGYTLFFNRAWLTYSLLYLLLFILSLLPFGSWNKVNHGVFKITPLEGGYGAMLQAGYWDYRLPVGFQSPYYWGIQIDDDLLQPAFMPVAEKQAWAQQYIRDWQEIEAKLAAGDSSKTDSLLRVYETNPAYAYRRNFYSFSTRYTLEREKLMKEKFINYVKADPWFYCKTRVYVFFRQWVTGINKTELTAATTLTDYFRVLYPFFVTFVFILGGLLVTGLSLLRKKISFREFPVFFLFIGYIAVIDIPFGVMSRYTVPVHLFILLLLSIIAGRSISRPQQVS